MKRGIPPRGPFRSEKTSGSFKKSETLVLRIIHDINDVEDVEEVLIMASHAFLDRKQDVKKKTNYISYYETQTKRIKFVFYKEDTTNVFFLRTCHIDKR